VSAPSPSWYDLLGVEPSATPDEIRAAWKSAIAELDPSDRRFRVLNQAAEVLLDPEERAAYDRSLAPAPVSLEKRPSAGSPGLETGASAPSSTTEVAPSSASAVNRAGPPAWLIAGLGIVAAALVAACVWAQQTAPPSAEEVAEATGDAQAAAGPAVEALLSYDYRDLEATRQAVTAVTTDEYRSEKYDPFFEGVIEPNIGNTKTIVEAEVVEAGIVRSGDDRVQVFVLVNRPTTNADTEKPVVYRDSATVTMAKVGDAWLIDDVETGILE
jgi:Mce-associated membrane protein